MKGINDELNQKIKKEVTAEKAEKAAKKLIEIFRPVTRSRIEYLKERAALEKDCYF